MRRVLLMCLSLVVVLAIPSWAPQPEDARGQAVMASCCPCDVPAPAPDCCPPPAGPASRCPNNPAPPQLRLAPAVPTVAVTEAESQQGRRREARPWTDAVQLSARMAAPASARWAEQTAAPPGYRQHQAQLGVFRI